ncbi:MAG: hypothetical protein ACHQ4J_12550 [Candidatus Binatia bacterium]
MSPPVHAAGPFGGVDLGVSQPVNGNYRAHVQLGGTANPYAGYMFNKYLGLQGQMHFTFQSPDNDHRGFLHENQTTTIVGGTVGPRISLPLDENFEFYGTGQGGVFTGLSGRMDQTGGGVSAGAGLDIHLTYCQSRPQHLRPLESCLRGTATDNAEPHRSGSTRAR